MASSVLVAVRKAVMSGIAASLNDRSVACTYGYEGYKDDSRREQIYSGRASASHDPASLKDGRNFRNERMDFDITVLVMGVGTSAERVDERAMELQRVVEEFIADNKNNEIGVPGLQWMRVSRVEFEPRFSADGNLAVVTVTVTYQARLT